MNILFAGAVIILMAALGAFLAVRLKTSHSQQPLQVKAVLFGLYFWGLVFFQLIIFGLGYYWNKV